MNKNQPSVFNLKYLPSRLIVTLLFSISFLSLKNKHRLGSWLGKLAKKKLTSRARVARKNIQACFPELSSQELEQMIEQCFIELTTGLIEGTHAWWQDMSQYKDSVKVTGLDNVLNAQKKGNGVLVLGGHFAVVDFAIPLFTSKVDNISYMYRPNNNPIIDNMIETGRAKAGAIGFKKSELKEMQTFIQDGGVAWYGCDQDFGKKAYVFAPFFGIDAINITSPSWLARETGAAVIFMGMRRLGPEQYEIEFSAELPGFGEDEQQDAIDWNKQLEDAVRRYPAQYMWVHKRFKTRPAGEPAFY